MEVFTIIKSKQGAVMKRRIMAIFSPPVAVCRYGCAGCCAAPIGVFWLAGVISIIYSFFGGPTPGNEFSIGTFLLGAALWVIAIVWAEVTIKGVEDDECASRSSTICRVVKTRIDESDPLDEVKKFQ